MYLPTSLIFSIAEHCSKLERISGVELTDLFVESIRLLRQNCTKLHTVVATRNLTARCSAIQSVQALCEGGNNTLESLTLSWCNDVDQALVTAAKNCPNLLSLSLHLPGIDIKVETIKIIAEYCHQLTKLWLGYGLLLIALGKGCPNLIDFDHHRHSCFNTGLSQAHLSCVEESIR